MPPEKPRLMVPTDDEDATRRFFVEALRANTKTMETLATSVEKVRDDVQDVRERVIRIEANPLAEMIKTNTERLDRHSKRLDDLERDKDRREGALSGFDWVFKNWPGVIGFFVLIVVVLKATGKI